METQDLLAICPLYKDFKKDMGKATITVNSYSGVLSIGAIDKASMLFALCSQKYAFFKTNISSIHVSNDKLCVDLPALNANAHASVIPNIRIPGILNTIGSWFSAFRIHYIASDKHMREVQEGDTTYRLSTTQSTAVFCHKHTEPIYDYLDVGRFICTPVYFNRDGVFGDIEEGLVQRSNHNNMFFDERYSTRFAFDEINADTFSICALSGWQPDLRKFMVKGCYVPTRDAKAILTKMEGALAKEHKARYKQLKDEMASRIDADIQASVVGKFYEGKIKSIKINDILLSQNKISYENISLQAEGLTIALKGIMNWGSEFDVYTCIRNYVEAQYKSHATTYMPTAERVKQTGIGGSAVPGTGSLNTNSLYDAHRQYDMVINGIPITAIHIPEKRWQINGTAINSDDVVDVLCRASCFQKAEDYKAFLESVSRFSLRLHDALINGVPIYTRNMGQRANGDRRQYARLRFKREGSKIHLITGENTSVIIPQFAAFVDRMANHDNWYRKYNWEGRAKHLLRSYAVVLREVVIPATDTKPEHTKLQQVPAFNEASLEDLFKYVDQARGDEIKRSTELLAKVVKQTEAQEETYKNMVGFSVQGKINKYFVEKESNKVFNYTNGKYVCIVNNSAQMGAGYDALAVRLMALKHDSVMVNHIHTLQK